MEVQKLSEVVTLEQTAATESASAYVNRTQKIEHVLERVVLVFEIESKIMFD